MTNFTPFASLFGGVLIGAAAVLLMALRGRIFGATGILSGLVFESDDRASKGALVLGMVTAPLLLWAFTGSMPPVDVPVSTLALIIGGIAVGAGVTYGGGCTSGHGVCGLARFSPRSLVATLTFMVVCFATVFVIRHVIGG